MEINNMRREKGRLKWRVTAHPLTKEYGATLQIRAPMPNPHTDLAELIRLALGEIILELEGGQ